jgi:phage FluMu protein Com
MATKKCSECGQTKAQQKKDGYDFRYVKCPKCKEWYCEACLIDGSACPNCSDLYHI